MWNVVFLSGLLSSVVTSTANVAPPYNISYYQVDIVNPHQPDHKIPLRMWYPTVPSSNDATFPILVFGHCLVGAFFDAEYTYIWQSLVPLGYIVAMPMSYEWFGEQEEARDIRYCLDWIRDNCTASNSCPLYNNIGDKATVSGHSLGGGASLYVIADWPLGQTFEYAFDSMITLSACGSDLTHKAAANISKPVFFLDGDHDCMCPPNEFADEYYQEVSDANGACKYEALITNATHCNFADLTDSQDAACLSLEEEDCAHPESVLSVKTQNSISAEYIAAFMNATLNEANSYGALNALIQSDLARKTLSSSASNNCF